MVRSSVIILAYFLSTLAAVACPNDQYEDAVTHVCLPKSNIQNVPNDIAKGLNAIVRGQAPGPAILGKVGAHKICLPWC